MIKNFTISIKVDKEEPDHWFAQGQDYDFFGSGKTSEEALSNCIESLSATMKAHLNEFGNLDGILNSEPFNKDINRITQ